MDEVVDDRFELGPSELEGEVEGRAILLGDVGLANFNFRSGRSTGDYSSANGCGFIAR